MRIIRYKIILLLAVLFANSNLFAQKEGSKCSVETDFSADFVSRYVWRGLPLGGLSPSIQPALSFATKGFEFGVWGSFSLDGINPAQEFDLYLSYTTANEMFSATITDYFFPIESANYNYFDFGKTTTGHLLEAMLSYNGTEKIPLSFMAAVNFWGADASKIVKDATSADFNTSSGIQYSTYFELGYSKSFENYDFKAFAGATLTNPLDADTATGFIGEPAYYGGKSGLINLGVTFSKELKITADYSLPLSVSVITNPRDKKIFFVFGMTF